MSIKQVSNWIWWKHGVIYHIYPKSFRDTNQDGIGDIRGIISRLGYLTSLGIDAIWLSPIYCSPMKDHGYDVSDYRAIDPVFGTMDDFMELLEKAHKAGLRIIMDMILNHTSDQHPWFLESASSRDNPKRNWYIWKEGKQGRVPNNWRSAVGGSAWTYDRNTREYYLHSFLTSQPDLNWRNPELLPVIFDEIKFWLDIGVDGFRFDVINMIAKDKQFRNNGIMSGIPVFGQKLYSRNRPRAVKVVRQLRALVDHYPDTVCIGEVYAEPPGSARQAAKYLANGDDGLHLAFDFSLLFSRWNAGAFFRCIRQWYDEIPEKGWPCTVMSNHDLLRHYNRYPWRLYKKEKARIVAFLLMTMKGTPFLYYGDEIGMQNTPIGRQDLKDPLGKKFWPLFCGRDPARTPMQWNDKPNGGFSEGKPWLPLNRRFKQVNVKKQEGDVDSLLNLYRNLIAVRKQYLSLSMGDWFPLINGVNGVLAWFRTHDSERTMILLNFTRKRRSFTLNDFSYGFVLMSTHRTPGEFFYLSQFEIHPFEAVIFLIPQSQ